MRTPHRPFQAGYDLRAAVLAHPERFLQVILQLPGQFLQRHAVQRPFRRWLRDFSHVARRPASCRPPPAAEPPQAAAAGIPRQWRSR